MLMPTGVLAFLDLLSDELVRRPGADHSAVTIHSWMRKLVAGELA